MSEETRAPYVFRGTALPEHLRESLDAYAKDGRPTGGFLQACIENDLTMAIRHGDDGNVVLMHVIVGYLYNECPHECWGAKGKFDKWIEAKRNERLKKETKQ